MLIVFLLLIVFLFYLKAKRLLIRCFYSDICLVDFIILNDFYHYLPLHYHSFIFLFLFLLFIPLTSFLYLFSFPFSFVAKKNQENEGTGLSLQPLLLPYSSLIYDLISFIYSSFIYLFNMRLSSVHRYHHDSSFLCTIAYDFNLTIGSVASLLFCHLRLFASLFA